MKVDFFVLGWIASMVLTLMPVENTQSQVKGDSLPISPETYKTAKKIDKLRVKEEEQNQTIQNLASGFDSTTIDLEKVAKSKDITIGKQNETFRAVRNSRDIVASLIPQKPKQTAIRVFPLPGVGYTVTPPDTCHRVERDVVPPEPERRGFFKRLNFLRKK